MTDKLSHLQQSIATLATWDEERCVSALLTQSHFAPQHRARACDLAAKLIEGARRNRRQRDLLDAFLEEFGLDTDEGVALMCLAEALLRIPDGDTADDLIQEKLLQGNWKQHLGQSDSLFVNASSWGLLLTGKWYQLGESMTRQQHTWLANLMDRLGEPVLRQAMLQAMRIMGQQYILGRSVREALKRAPKEYGADVLCSFDALGEGARTQQAADAHFKAYQEAIATLSAEDPENTTSIYCRHSVSIKLSALHPRYQYSQKQRVLDELLPRVIELCQQAKQGHIALSIDAEESERLDIELDLFRELAAMDAFSDWPGLGFVLQAYQKRAVHVVDWLVEIAAQRRAPICVRLVKGAYWDREIKRAQQLGLSDYPVFTRKTNTDLSYLVCAEKLFAAGNERIFPQFATHNALTIASVCELAGDRLFELQRLHGMGDLLYEQVHEQFAQAPQVRVYAPVGGHKDLLPYLVRRLLENGANSSFVNRFMDEQVPSTELAADVITRVQGRKTYRHPSIPLPKQLYPDRPNASGMDLENPACLRELVEASTKEQEPISVFPIINGKAARDAKSGKIIANPSDARVAVSKVFEAGEADIKNAAEVANNFFPQWNALGGGPRADILEKIAQAFENNKEKLLHLIVKEAGRTLGDAESEVREAIDFCHYYGLQARKHFSKPNELPGPTGECNQLLLEGRGVFVCISPWNFPLAIFVGQILAALAAGNTVLAKPAEQTPAVAQLAVQLMLEAGLPPQALHLLPGDGATVGKTLLDQDCLQGIAFTGSTETAKIIHQQLAARDGAIIPLIAETGGINAMIVDSTALIEHVVDDVLRSAFHSAGQRCSALRLLIVQDEIADDLIAMLKGACTELQLGSPALPSTDLGPVIDESALNMLKDYVAKAPPHWERHFIYPSDRTPQQGYFFGPHILEVPEVAAVTQEVFGPVLHLLRFKRKHYQKIIGDINNLGFGLTLGIHTRIEQRAQELGEKLRVGNVYINRNMIGAVVGVQPFGGTGLSGTGPKAGGPHYLPRFAAEKSVSINTMATGGNAQLLNLED